VDTVRHAGASACAPQKLAAAAMPAACAPWYYADSEQAVGPFGLADLIAELQKNSSWKDLLVCRQDSDAWQRAGSCKEILAHLAPPAAPQKDIASEARSEPPPAPKKTSSWPVARILGGIVLLAVGVAVGASWTMMKPLMANSSGIEEENAKALVQLRTELPKKIDETTTLTWARSEGTKLIYENRVAIDGARLDDATKGKLRHAVTRNVCEAPSTRRMLDRGGSFEYVYTDIAGKPLTTIDVGKNDCT
jgi:hypothetical protein